MNPLSVDEIVAIICYIIASSMPSLPMDTIRDGNTWNMISASLVCKQWRRCTPFNNYSVIYPLMDVIQLMTVFKLKNFIYIRKLEKQLLSNVLTIDRHINKLCKIIKTTNMIIYPWSTCDDVLINPYLRTLNIYRDYLPTYQHIGTNDLQIEHHWYKQGKNRKKFIMYTAIDNTLIIDAHEIYESTLKEVRRVINANSVKKLIIIGSCHMVWSIRVVYENFRHAHTRVFTDIVDANSSANISNIVDIHLVSKNKLRELSQLY